MYLNKRVETSSPKEMSHLPKEDLLVWLMDEYGDMVIRLAYMYVKEKQLAEDISQEVFINCFNSLDKFQNRATYKTWLYRITVNKCKDVLKSWSYKNILYKETISSFLRGRSQSIDCKLEEIEERDKIFVKVITLPIKLREVIILHYYEELSIHEISELLSLNSNTVKTRLHRGRNVLKLSFEEAHVDEK